MRINYYNIKLLKKSGFEFAPLCWENSKVITFNGSQFVSIIVSDDNNKVTCWYPLVAQIIKDIDKDDYENQLLQLIEPYKIDTQDVYI